MSPKTPLELANAINYCYSMVNAPEPVLIREDSSIFKAIEAYTAHVLAERDRRRPMSEAPGPEVEHIAVWDKEVETYIPFAFKVGCWMDSHEEYFDWCDIAEVSEYKGWTPLNPPEVTV